MFKYTSSLQNNGKTGKRTCFHAGANTLPPNVLKTEKHVSGWVIVKKMLSYVWPKDKPRVRIRVLVALGLLVGSKVSVLVP